MRADRLRVLDAIEQIQLILEFSKAGREHFMQDPMVQSAVLHRLTLLGEACRGMSAEFRQCHAEVPWPQIIAFRNILLHQYFGVDLELVWQIVEEYVPGLNAFLGQILSSLPD